MPETTPPSQVTATPNLNLALKPGGPRDSNFRPVKASDLLAAVSELMDWTWDGFLPVGCLALLAAYMKVGKSTFAYALAVAIAQGRPFLGRATRQGPVLILAVEEHKRDVYARLERFGLTSDELVFVHTGPLDPSALPAIARFVRDNGVTLVMLDTLSRYWRIKDENDNAEVMKLVSPFIDLAHELNVTVVLIHHETKAGGDGGRSIRGGSALFGAVDQALFLEKRPGGGNANARVLRTLGRYADSVAELVFTLEDDEYEALGTPQDLSHAAELKAMESFLTDVPQTIETVAALAKCSVSVATKRLNELARLGRAKHHGKGVRGEPFTYCRPAPDSILANPEAIERETISDAEAA